MSKSPFDLTDDELDAAMAEAGAEAAKRAFDAGIPVYESVDGELRLWRPDEPVAAAAERKLA